MLSTNLRSSSVTLYHPPPSLLPRESREQPLGAADRRQAVPSGLQLLQSFPGKLESRPWPALRGQLTSAHGGLDLDAAIFVPYKSSPAREREMEMEMEKERERDAARREINELQKTR